MNQWVQPVALVNALQVGDGILSTVPGEVIDIAFDVRRAELSFQLARPGPIQRAARRQVLCKVIAFRVTTRAKEAERCLSWVEHAKDHVRRTRVHVSTVNELTRIRDRARH